jgi:hypothetical protein
MNYSKFLNPSGAAASADMNTFHDYEIGEIDLDECFNEWWRNNKPKLNRAEFRKWLKSMGYSRRFGLEGEDLGDEYFEVE